MTQPSTSIAALAHLVAQLVPPLEEGRAGDVAVVLEAGPGLLADGKVHVLDLLLGHGLALRVVEHVVVHAAVRLQRARGVGQVQEVVGEEACRRD